ncbi:unnamed protein product [Blumeria hordei]|uniref:Uncharacterized protein n=1 Tax=Blumeria hordei TaxID=2867405 RepID=A0A383UTN8_BLUHO|nr:unnamed protein product [Blumeria hordei]
MPFDFATYRAKCGRLTAEELQVEWQNYTRQLSTGATTTATSVLLSPVTHGISLVGLGISVPQVHNARKKRAIIVDTMQLQGAEPHTRRRDIIFPSAISVATAALTLGFTPHFAVALGGEASAKGIEYLISHVALDVVWTILGESYAVYLKKRETRKIKRQQHRHQHRHSLKYHATDMGEKKISAGRERSRRFPAHSDSDTSDSEYSDDARFEKESLHDDKAHLFEFKPQAARGKANRPGQRRGHNRRAGHPGHGMNSHHSYNLPTASNRRKQVQRSPSQPPSQRSYPSNIFDDKTSRSPPKLPPRRLSMVDRAINISPIRNRMDPVRGFTREPASTTEVIDTDSDSDDEDEKALVSDSDEDSNGSSSDENSDDDSDKDSDEDSDEEKDKEFMKENYERRKVQVDEKNMELVLTMEEEIALLKATILRMEMEKRGIVVEPNAGMDPTFVRETYAKLKDGIPAIDQVRAQGLESAGLKNAKDLSMKRRSPEFRNSSHIDTLNKMPPTPVSLTPSPLPKRHTESRPADAKTTSFPVIAKPPPEYQSQVDESEKTNFPRLPYKTRPVQMRRDSGYFSNYSSSSLVSISGSTQHGRRQSLTSSPGSGLEAMKEFSSQVLTSSKMDNFSLNMDSNNSSKLKMATPYVTTRQISHHRDPSSTHDDKSTRNLENSPHRMATQKNQSALNSPSVRCELPKEKCADWEIHPGMSQPVMSHHLPTPQVVVNASTRSWRAPA